MSVHIVWHDSSLAHDGGLGHPESPERLRAILGALRQSSQDLEWHEAGPASRAQLERVHPAAYLDRLEGVSTRGGGRLDPDTTMNAESWTAAVHAAGAAVGAVQLAMASGAAFAPIRPPGHHATRDRAMGFCLVNNVVVAARAALDEFAQQRVLIVDWDVHHGNGTQDLVEEDERVRYVSLHQSPLYPGTGREDERGVGNVFNVPRPPGLPRRAYVEDLNAAVHRATEVWRPDLLIISAGFDALAGDPLAGFTLEPDDYAEWVEEWSALGAPIVSVLEGGYVPERIAAAAVSHLGPLADHARAYAARRS
jgi:acetoin utilization deacetylase AcuC-like enzyme